MKKVTKKTIMAFFLVATLILGASPVFANISVVNEARSIQLQADSLIAAVDVNSLNLDAMNNVIDYSVPLSVRENVAASADFSPIVGVAEDAIELEVNSTVQKVGEIVLKNGDTANLYVAVAAASVKTDSSYTSQYGIKAWADVYWIDNLGPGNQLDAAGASWDPKSVTVRNREVRYGTSDITGTFWLSGPTLKTTTLNDVYYPDSSYTGLTLRCQTKIEVVNTGTVTCNVTSRVAT